MSVADHLAGAGARRSETEPVDRVVQPPLHDAQEDFAGVFRRARRQLEIASKLPLEHAVESLQLLLLPQAHAVFARLAAAGAMHARWLVATLNGALGALAPTSLCAANGVLLRLPLKPTVPAEAKQSTSPFVSVMVTMVLLKVALM